MPDDVLSAREALEKAFASSPEPETAVEEAPAVEEVPEAPEVAEAPARERDERGRFAPKAAGGSGLFCDLRADGPCHPTPSPARRGDPERRESS